MFYLYHTQKGWLTPQSTYTSDVKQAKEWQGDDAITRCRRMRIAGQALVLPIRVEDMESI